MRADFWYALKMAVPEEEQEIVAALLFQRWALGFENRLDSLVAYFPPKAPVEEIRSWLETADGLKRASNVQLYRVPAENWNEQWKKNFKPLPVGRRFLVAPSWNVPQETGGRLLLKIDPGMAFGTGTHETTQLVLRLMEDHLRPGLRVWDVGTGSGILAIAAARMGLASIVANDVDPVAVEAALENAKRNHVAEKIRFFVGPPRALRCGAFDVILMNMISRIIYAVFSDVAPFLKPGGRVLFSGVLAEEKEHFLEKLVPFPVRVTHCEQQGEWIGMVAEWKKT